MMLIRDSQGRVMEKMVTSDEAEMERYMTSSPESAVPESERQQREAYHYSRVRYHEHRLRHRADQRLHQGRSLLMRSQLDCKDRRLPGKGTFDVKTRAALVIRHDRANYVVSASSLANVLADRLTCGNPPLRKIARTTFTSSQA